jgi:hypothetical protein
MEHGDLEVVSRSKDTQHGKFVAQCRQRYIDHTKEGYVGKDMADIKDDFISMIATTRIRAEKSWEFRAVRQEDINVLEEFGFLWRSPKLLDWDEVYENLKAYKEKHGHCKVPQLYKDEGGCKLGFWICAQRKAYESWSCGQKTPITSDRIQKLEALGFVWKLRHGRPKKGDKNFRNKRYGIGYDNPELNEKGGSDITGSTDVSNQAINDAEQA